MVFYLAEDFWPLNTALYVRDFKGNNPRFVAALLESMHLEQHDGAAAVPGLNRNQLHELAVRIPGRQMQDRIAAVIERVDDLTENSHRRVELLEQMARSTYREWFVCFRHPGRGGLSLVESPLGRIPSSWQVLSVAALASRERNAVTGGPFYSKLGRKDYRDQGVPVVRGTNLRVGGGWDETDLIFVSEEKAKELASSTTRPGDIVVTQRGTLGQVGLIPADSNYKRYLLSQSQMKVTIDPALSTAEFVYSQLRTPETTERFIAQAMTAGVPHVNLGLLRDFQLLVPPLPIQVEFSEVFRPLSEEGWALRRQVQSLRSLRDLLLSKLVSGQIDLSSINLDDLLESAAA